MIIKSLSISLLVLSAGMASAQFKPTDQGSSLQFTIKNFGCDVGGTFTGLQGNIKFDTADVAASNFDVSIDASSVNTDNSLRDSHLKGDSYFDVKNYPRIKLVSDKVAAGKNGQFVLTGKLTIKKQTKNISFPFSVTPTNDGYWFKGSFTINRKDFDVGGTSTIADNLEVSLSILAKRVN